MILDINEKMMGSKLNNSFFYGYSAVLIKEIGKKAGGANRKSELREHVKGKRKK